jgi:CelD/BcsL family acetyltransferase involved in cellulose biosynthesis
MHKNGWIQIEMLYINDEPVAFQYGYHISNKYQDWRGAYDAKYETLGTGKILMMFSLKKWFEQQIQEVDFLRGTHSYKADWQPLTRDFIDLRIFRVQKLETLMAYIWLNTLKPIIKRN